MSVVKEVKVSYCCHSFRHLDDYNVLGFDCEWNWEVDTLLDLQIDYAAKDAHVSLELFKVFGERLKPKPIDCNQRQHLQEFIEEYCMKYMNLKGNPNEKTIERVDHFENQEIRYVNNVDECLRAIEVLKS